MKTRFLILALAALSFAPLMPSCNPYSQMVARQEDGMAKLNSALANVQDRASADAAAPVVQQYGSLLRQDVISLFSNGRPSLMQLLLLKNSYQNSNIRTESKSALREFFRIYGQGFYGSTTLRQAFIDMLRNNNTQQAPATTPTPSTTPTQAPILTPVLKSFFTAA